MSLGGLDSALSGLRVAQQQLSVISNNISNVATPGYTRKILPQSALTIDGVTVGVRTDPLIRRVDMNLERDYWTQVSSVSMLDTQITYLNKIQQFHGGPDSETSIAAELAELRDDFAALSDSPESTFLQRGVLDQASRTAEKINDLSDLITKLRNDAEDEMGRVVTNINRLLEQIASINKDIKFNTAVGKTTAELSDARDSAVKELTAEIDITFFFRGDGVMVVQTADGEQLADERAETLFFEESNLAATTYYPVSANGIFINDPNDNAVIAVDIADEEVGGRLGGLLELRDDILPRNMAQLDELAHKIALRFDAQGLRLFTDDQGAIPADTAPIPDPPGPLTPVEYVGFSSLIRVNQALLNDNTLVTQGTVSTDIPVQTGSNEVIRRVLEFSFGNIDYQEAVGDVDLRSTGTGGVSLQEWLGLYSQNIVTGTKNLSSYADLATLLAAGDEVFNPTGAAPPYMDEFNITFADPRLGVPPQTYTIGLDAVNTAFPIAGPITDALDQLIAAINNLAPPTDPAFDVVASRSPYGQLVISTRANVTFDASVPALPMGQEGLTFLGFIEDTYETEDPYLDIQVGKDPPVRVTIEPGDDETDLMTKIEYDALTGIGVPGLFADMAAGTGFLTIRPGNDDSNGGPVFGGDIKIVGGSLLTDGTGGAGIAAGSTVVESLFGNNNPIANILYDATIPFRFEELGPGVDISTGVISSTDILDYAQKLVNRQTEEIINIEARQGDEESFRQVLEKELLDGSGVNIDEELSNLIVVQTAYAAAARAISAVQNLFDELLSVI